MKLLKLISSFLSQRLHENVILLLIISTVLSYGAVEYWASFGFSLLIGFGLLALILFSNSKNTSEVTINYQDVFILGFFLYEVLSLFYSKSFYTSRQSVLLNINYFLFFYYVYWRIKTKSQILYLVHGLLLFGGVYATIALTIIGLDFLGIKNYSNSDYITLTFVNRNHFSGLLEMLVYTGIALSLLHTGSKRILYLFTSAYIATAIFFSLSRGGILSLSVSLVFLALMLTILEKNKKYGIVIISFAFIVLLLLLFLGLDPIIERLGTLENPELAGKGRLEYWKGSLNMIKDNFWLGTGIGTFAIAYPMYQTTYANSMFVTHPHNDYLELFTETGFIGFLVFSGIILSIFNYIIRNYKQQQNPKLRIISLSLLASIFSILIHSVTDFNFQIPSNVFLIASIAAIAINSIKDNSENKALFTFRISPKKWLKPLKTVLILSFILLNSAYYYSYKLYRAALPLKIQKEYNLAESHLLKAQIIDPFNPDIDAELGDISYRQSQATRNIDDKENYLTKALEYYNIALDKLQINGEFYLKKAYILMDLDENKEAISAMEKAVHYMPTKAQIRYNYAHLLLQNNQPNKAIPEFTKTLEISYEYLNTIVDKLQEYDYGLDSIAKIIPQDIENRKRYARKLTKEKQYLYSSYEWENILKKENTVYNSRNLVSNLINANRQQDAIRALDTLVFIHVDDNYLQKRYITILNRKKNFTKSVGIIEELLHESQNKENLNILLAQTYSLDRKIMKADSIYLRSTIEYPNNANIHYQYGLFCIKQNNYEKALDYLKKAQHINPQNINYAFQLGKAYENLKLYEFAIEQFQTILEQNPNHQASIAGIKRINQKLNTSAK